MTPTTLLLAKVLLDLRDSADSASASARLSPTKMLYKTACRLPGFLSIFGERRWFVISVTTLHDGVGSLVRQQSRE